MDSESETNDTMLLKLVVSTLVVGGAFSKWVVESAKLTGLQS